MKKQLRNKKQIYVNKNTYLVKINKMWKVAHKGACDSHWIDEGDDYGYYTDCEGIIKLDELRMKGLIK